MHPSVASLLGLPSGSSELGPVHVAEAAPAKRALTEADAIEIWVARWLRVRRKDLVSRYGCDPRRLYEVWWGERFPAAREKAADVFRERYPALVDRTAFGYRRIPRTPEGADTQLRLFD
jgi:hypothetical protein